MCAALLLALAGTALLPDRALAAVPTPPTPAATDLPAPVGDPMRIDPAADPVLALGRTNGSEDVFRTMIGRAVREAPSSAEATAERDAAVAARGQARAGLFPYVDVSGTSYRAIARNFSNDINNIVERSRAAGRTDATVNIQQTVLDFGATSIRIAAAGARLRAAAAGIDASADQVALGAIGAWYDVFVYRALVRLGAAFAQSQRDLRVAVEQRVKEGVSAPGDVARVESYIASADVRLAGYRRSQANAEARFTELLREPPPAQLPRAPLLDRTELSRDYVGKAALATPTVRLATAQADAARQDARAARADTLPVLTAGVQAGRYGVLENPDDYDVRGVMTIRKRFFGGVDARADQVRAQANVAEARAARAREEAARDATIAWSDVQALVDQAKAFQESYIAARRSRDVLFERFRVSRGSLFDVLGAEDSFFLTASAYIQGVGELDAARYVLLSRTGRLLDALAIPPAPTTPGRGTPR
ncbi:TolC family protein [Sphingomonas prati]|uniref:Adhesin transport system outer membrane protein n=1 Tax=Sphingomonas prati TaxID=1843237 RepID=A0A7W9F1C7_9SPHN|nr:TolC family protein [Sphingomonas prati]MBB5729362.1 adhesin transport system outer membrane protein [Sphingomonas prati]GGE78089.1 channel protein TolC [Sphingomonas prati]